MERMYTIIKTTVLVLATTFVSLFSLAQIPIKKFLDPVNMDLTVHPGDNFYLYANGNWLKNNPVPKGEIFWNGYEKLRPVNALKGLIEKAAGDRSAPRGSVTRRVGDFYLTAMDTISIEARGAAPIKPYLEKINSIKTKQELFNEMSRLYASGISSHLFYLDVEIDSKNTKQMIVKMGQSGTTYDSRDYYLEKKGRYPFFQDNLKKYIGNLFILSGVPKQTAEQYAISIFEVEKKIATVQKSRQERADRSKNYNKFQVKDFCKTLPGLKWLDAFRHLKVKGEDSIRVINPYFIKAVDSLLTEIPLRDWKIFLQWNILKTTAKYLSSPFINAESLFNQAVSGQSVQPPRWRGILGFMDYYLGDLTGQLYVSEYFNPEAKIGIVELVKNICKAFANRIQQLDWMSPTTKEKALKKLDAIVVNIGYPDQWANYDGLVLSSHNYFENVMNVIKWEYDFRFRQLGKPVQKNSWVMTIATDAWYNAVRNEITFGAGFLRYPFFDPNAEDAVNYGAIGVTIGHELSHAFDVNGSKFDADGTQRNWWTDEDRLKFEGKTKELVKQYNKYTVQDTIHVNGILTLNENIADLGGLNVAYDAFKMTKQGQSTSLVDGLTPDQRFFLSRAQICRENVLPQTEVNRIENDNHAPLRYRVIGAVVNMDAWYNAFNIKPGNKLYTKPEDRIRIW